MSTSLDIHNVTKVVVEQRLKSEGRNHSWTTFYIHCRNAEPIEVTTHHKSAYALPITILPPGERA